MRSAFVTFVALTLWAATLQGVVAIPLRAVVMDGTPSNVQKIKEATEIANKQVHNMQAVLNGPNPKAHPAVVKAFGTNANIPEIKANVEKLANGKIVVPSPEPAAGITQGATNVNDKKVTFGSAFFNSDAKTRAGTVLHEATHAIHGAVDHFDQHGNPHPQGTTFDRTKAQVGYKDSHMEQLKAQASHNMHHNADSYRVFGEECPEARELFERALEEEDLEIRSHLVRRAGAACAYRPKGKGKAAHHAATHATAQSKAEARFARKSAKKAAKAERAAKKAAKGPAPAPKAKKGGPRRGKHA
ncbi:hypothetical protein CVT26_003543 [Gymnopilus dilepis]|uniref:Lysine-specific metallo-endopeptidase domain-containing protein n=1 Tax=Gymnopilus dilepis TaxID=231916 RepID=A0A409VSG1_9AGAR|nr:hypothetical protein CVT26_003543 [Gymnopilus dilepis]